MWKQKFKLHIRSAHILAILFLLFITIVGYVAFPNVLISTAKVLQGQKNIHSYINQITDQYSVMLDTTQEYSYLQNKGTYINLNGFWANKLGQPIMNERIKLKNGHLTNVVTYQPEPEEIQKAANKIIQFYNAHTSSGGHFLFVASPCQISKYENLLPVGYMDTSNDTADAFLSLLQQAGVPYLDLREEMHKDGISVSDAFFATDHHWTPQTGFWAYGKILNKLAQIGAIRPVDPYYTDPSNYTFEIYPDTFLGSSGKRTGIHYAGIDDSIYIRPNFDTQINVRIPQRDLDIQGRYEEVAYNTDVLHNYENPDFYQENCYGLYGWGDTEITHWRNEQACEQGKFLMIGESFGNIPFSLMSIYLSSCDEMDMRHFKDDFTTYYHSYKPDTVVLELNVMMILSEFTDTAYLK